MKFKLSLISSLLFSAAVSAQNMVVEGDFEGKGTDLTQFSHSTSPWQLVDYLDSYSAVAGQYQPSPGQLELVGESIMFVKNGAVRQQIQDLLTAGESYVLSVDLGRNKHGSFPGYRIGLQTGDKFVELASTATHGVPDKGKFTTLEVEYQLGDAHEDFLSGSEPVYLLIEALSEAGNSQLLIDNVKLQPGTLSEVSVVSDSDGDGIPDRWEEMAGLDPLNAEDALWDSDGDGVSNLVEYQKRSDPQNPTDQLRPVAGKQVKELKLAQAPGAITMTRLPIEISGIRFIPLSSEPLPCAADSEGGLYYNATSQLTMVCSGNAWKPVQGQDRVDDADADASNELQTLSRSGSQIILSNNGGSVEDKVDDADADASNEIQVLSRSGTTITLSKSGGSFEDKVEDADADSANEIQVLSKLGSTVTLSKSGGSFTDAVNDADANPTNEIQTLSMTGNVISLTQGGSVTLNNNDADANPTNELQTLTLAGNKLSLSNGGGEVTLTDQVNDADANSTNELVTAVTYDANAQRVTVREGSNSRSATLSNLASKSYVDNKVQAAVAASSGGFKFVAFGQRDGEYCNISADKGGYMSTNFCSCSGGSYRVQFSNTSFACVLP